MSRICQVCKTDNLADAIFCDNCGTPISQTPPGNQPQQNLRTIIDDPGPLPPPPSAAEIFNPRLVIKPSNEILNLPAYDSEMIIGRQDPLTGDSPDIDLLPHGGRAGGVSRQHAKLTIRSKQCFIQDLQSANSTYINGRKISPGEHQLLNHGAELRLGGVEIRFYAH